MVKLPFVFRCCATSFLGLALLSVSVAQALPSAETRSAKPVAPLESPVTTQVHEPLMMLSMGTVITGVVYADNREALERYFDAFEKDVTRYDSLLTVHRDSPLNNVNKYAGQKVEVPLEVAELIERSVQIAKDSHGVFQPMIGPVVNLWRIGFGGEKVPSEEAIKKAVALVDSSKVKVTYGDGKAWAQIGPGQSIDLGGIAKGYIGTAMAEHLEKLGMKRGLINLGGNVVAIGEKAPGEPWLVGLQIPGQARGEPFAVVKAANTSIVTSGDYERYIEVDGKRYAHILSPTTGRPATTDLAAVTIISKDGTFADAWCTALFAMGWDRAKAYLEAHPEVACIILNGDMKRVLVTEPAKALLAEMNPGYDVEVIR